MTQRWSRREALALVRTAHPFHTLSEEEFDATLDYLAGGGASLSWGRTELFIETRVLSFDPTNAPQSRQMPFMFGMNWF